MKRTKRSRATKAFRDLIESEVKRWGKEAKDASIRAD
jgi:hypothetical protein